MQSLDLTQRKDDAERQRRIMRLTATGCMGFRLPPRDSRRAEPKRQAAPLAQRPLTLPPVGDPELRTRSRRALLGIDLVRHGDDNDGLIPYPTVGIHPTRRRPGQTQPMAGGIQHRHRAPSLYQPSDFGRISPLSAPDCPFSSSRCWRSDRDGPMQVVSAHAVRPQVHFEAPPAGQLAREMRRFLAWFNGAAGMDPLLRAGLAHLWFVTIHPLDDDNGRIARAIADLAVAQMERTGQRFYSLSSQIEREKRGYYQILEATQKRDLDVTPWLTWFVDCYARAIDAAVATATKVTTKASFWSVHAGRTFSDRQRKVLGRLLDDFEGAITARKWASLCSCSPDTAQRDIGELVEQGLLVKNPGGSKKTSYRFNWPPE